MDFARKEHEPLDLQFQLPTCAALRSRPAAAASNHAWRGGGFPSRQSEVRRAITRQLALGMVLHFSTGRVAEIRRCGLYVEHDQPRLSNNSPVRAANRKADGRASLCLLRTRASSSTGLDWTGLTNQPRRVGRRRKKVASPAGELFRVNALGSSRKKVRRSSSSWRCLARWSGAAHACSPALFGGQTLT